MESDGQAVFTNSEIKRISDFDASAAHISLTVGGQPFFLISSFMKQAILEYKNDSVREILLSQAKDNTWTVRAKTIISLTSQLN